MEKAVSGPAALFQMFQAHHVSAALRGAVDIGLFGAIHGGARDVAAIAEKIQCPERSTRIVADALVALGLLKKEGPHYALGPLAAEHLVPGKPEYLGELANVMGADYMWQALSHLGDAIKAGGCTLPEHAETPQLRFWETFAQSTTAMSVPGTLAVHDVVGPWLASRDRPTFLDVAAGSGTYGYTMVKQVPALRATLLDWPNVLVETRRMGKQFGVDEQRVNYIEGNLFDVDFGGPYDVVLMSQIFHHFGPTVCESLLVKAASALKRDGKLVIHDFLTDGDNPAARMFSLTMLATTKKGESFASTDFEPWCKGAGLTSFSVHAVSGAPTSIIVAGRG